MDNWTLLTSDSDANHLRLVQAYLENLGVEARLIDHTDSALPSNAVESELYVQKEQLEAAKTHLAAYSRS